MARTKEKEWMQLNFSIDCDIAERFKELARFEKLTNTAFLELLVLRWDEAINPEIKLGSLLNERKEVDGKLNRIDNNIKEVSDQIFIFNKLRQQKRRKKPEALKRIEEQLIKGNFEGAEKISRFLQKETGISSLELIMEAQANIKEKGI